jgi:hypothetical protein
MNRLLKSLPGLSALALTAALAMGGGAAHAQGKTIADSTS